MLREGTVILLRSWSTLYIAFAKCIVSWFQFFYFDLPLLTQSAFGKVKFFWTSRCSGKKAVISLRSWSALYIAFSKCSVLIVVVLSWFAVIYPKCMYKRHLLFWIIFVDFCSALVTQIPYLIFLYSGNLSCSVKKAMILLLAWPTLYILVSRYSLVSNSMSKTDLFEVICGAPHK